MTQLTIQLTLPDEMGDELRERALKAGHSTVEDFVRAILIQELDRESEDYGAPPHLSINSEEELEALARERVNDPSPAIEVTAEFWESLKARIRQRSGNQPE
jgi:plasmid stability protein